jgi:hypothetical protein
MGRAYRTSEGDKKSIQNFVGNSRGKTLLGKYKRGWRIMQKKKNVAKAYGGVKEYLHVFLTSALDGDEWSASCPDRFTPGKEPPVPIG